MQGALQILGGSVLALSTDSVADNAALVQEEGLAFPILADEDAEVVRLYQLEHAQADPLDGGSIAIPAQFLIDSTGKIVWRHIARRITDRASPSTTLEAVMSHFGTEGQTR